VDDGVLKNAAKSGEEWLTYGQNPWRNPLQPAQTDRRHECEPAGIGLVVRRWPGRRQSGGDSAGLERHALWHHELERGFRRRCAHRQRTLAVGSGSEPDGGVPKSLLRGCESRLGDIPELIIAPIIDGRLEALDAETGKPVWESRVAYPQDNYTITMAPRIAKGKVIVGVSGSEYPVRGFFAAFDANTGHFAWKFYTVPGDPSKPFENAAMKKAAETWSPEAWKMGGGGTVWDGMAWDPESDLIYVGTGNAGPWPEQLRKSKGKDNLYACSVLAVRPDTGELKWYFQMVPGDSWDYDSVQQLMLADLTIKGRQRKVLMQANKDGFYYVLDRVTGQFISGQPWVQVNWAKGLDEKSPGGRS
jgi:PQQ-dependent dehydrogenase (methanol/ethanol family)